MDTAALQLRWPELVEHMWEAGYSESYVASMRRLIDGLIDAMPGLECWGDAFDWVVQARVNEMLS